MRHAKISSVHGNALFLILVAVALFAALSYAITQSSRGSANIDREKAVLLAAEITNHMNEIYYAVLRFTASGACHPDEVAFYTTEGEYDPAAFPMYPQQTGAPDPSQFRAECNVYDIKGGGVVPRPLPEEVRLDITSIAHPVSRYVSKVYAPYRGYITGIGQDWVTGMSAAERAQTLETVIAVQLNSATVCAELNRGLGIANPGGSPPVAMGSGNLFSHACQIRADTTCSTIQSVSGAILPDLVGKHSGCFANTAATAVWTIPRFTYYRVVIAR